MERNMRHKRQISIFFILSAVFLFISITAAFPFAHEKDLRMIGSKVVKIYSIERNLNQNFLIFCGLHGKSALLQIIDTLNWPVPDSIKFIYNITLDSGSNIVNFTEISWDETQYWRLDLNHYFDEDGHILKYTHYFGTFASGCTKILRDERDLFFTKEGQLIEESRIIGDENYKPIDTTGCHFFENSENRVFKTVGELIAKKNLLRAFLKIDK